MSKTRGTWRRFVLNHCVRAKRVWLKNLHLQSLHVSCPVFFTVQVRCENWDAGPVPIAWFNLLTLKKGTCSHKYLGRKYSGDLTKRRRIGFQHRVHLAWAKFDKIANHWQTSAFQSSYACICFDAVVTPTILFGLTTWTASDLNQLDAIQRRMLRSLVGWVHVQDEPGKRYDDSYEACAISLCLCSSECPPMQYACKTHAILKPEQSGFRILNSPNKCESECWKCRKQRSKPFLRCALHLNYSVIPLDKYAQTASTCCMSCFAS